MSTIIMSFGVVKSDKVYKDKLTVINIGKKRLAIPIFWLSGKTLDDKRKEAHRLVDECVDCFEKDRSK